MRTLKSKMEPPKLNLSGPMPTYGPVYPWCMFEDGKIHVSTESEYIHRHGGFAVSTLIQLIARLETEDVTDEILKYINEHMFGKLTRELLGLKDGDCLTADMFVFID